MVKSVEIKEIQDGLLDVKVIVEQHIIKENYDKSSLNVQNKSSIKGFRKGKAPLALVQNVYKSEIQYETINSIFPSIYNVLTSEHKVNPVATPEISGIDNFKTDQDMTLELKIEIAPYLKDTVQVSSVHPKKVRYSYQEEELLEKELESLQQVHAQYRALEGEIREGDFVQVRYSIDSEDFKREDTTHYVMVKRNDPQFEFTSHLIGKNLGTTYTETITFSSLYVEKELADKTVSITFTPIEGRTVESPDMNDELAQKFGFDTVDILKNEVRSVLKKRAEMKGLFDTLENILKAICEQSTFSIGEKVILSQTQHHLQKKLQDIMQKGQFDQYTKENQFSDENFIAEVRSDAKQTVEKYLVSQDLINKKNIEASDEELDQFIQEIAQQEIPNRQEIIDFYRKNTEKKEGLRHQLLTQKLALTLQEEVTFEGENVRTMEHQNLGA